MNVRKHTLTMLHPNVPTFTHRYTCFYHSAHLEIDIVNVENLHCYAFIFARPFNVGGF